MQIKVEISNYLTFHTFFLQYLLYLFILSSVLHRCISGNGTVCELWPPPCQSHYSNTRFVAPKQRHARFNAALRHNGHISHSYQKCQDSLQETKRERKKKGQPVTKRENTEKFTANPDHRKSRLMCVL